LIWSIALLLNIGHGGTMAETGNGFPASQHNKAEANRIFDGGPWRLLLTWRVAVASRLRRKNRNEKTKRNEILRVKEKKSAERQPVRGV